LFSGQSPNYLEAIPSWIKSTWMLTFPEVAIKEQLQQYVRQPMGFILRLATLETIACREALALADDLSLTKI
jgi:hypothetical protein